MLTLITCKNAKPKEKPYKIADGSGLYLEIHPNGSKYWRQKYRFKGKEKRLSHGVFPEVSLQEARDKCTDARRRLREGVDPGDVKKRENVQVGETFYAMALAWYNTQKGHWTPRYADYVWDRLEKDVLPSMGKRQINSITTPELLALLQKVQDRGAMEIAVRLARISSQIFCYGIAMGKGENDPAAAMRGLLKRPKKKHYSYLAKEELPEFLHCLENYQGEIVTRLGMKLVLLTLARTTEVRAALKSEINIEKALWQIPAERMKMRRPHIIPLPTQALEVIEQLSKHNSRSEYLFPQPYKQMKHMSECTLIGAMYRMGYHSRSTVHGFRHLGSTVLHEQGFPSIVIERQLAHVDKNKIRGTYNHAEYLEERRKMMQWWADELDKMRAEAALKAREQ